MALVIVIPLAPAQERCGAGRDLVVRALERVRPGSADADVEDGLQLLKTATGECAGLGDAWYYRSLFERKLKHANLADFALRQAKLVGSDAMNESVDPFTLSAPVDKGPPGPVRQKWALVVGIGRFKDRSIRRLRYTSKDAQDFAALLQDPNCGRFKPENVHVLTDDKATTVGIKSELNWLARNAAPDDLVVIFIASHGSPRELDTVGVNYVITEDTDTTDQDSLYATALPMVDVVQVLSTRIQARRAVVLLDTCHSGGAVANGVKTSAPATATLDRFSQGFGRVIITSSQASETSFENQTAGNGYFTYSLMQALRKENGLAPIGKIYESVRQQVSRQVQTDWHMPQNPVMSRSEQGEDIVLGQAPAAVAIRVPSLPDPSLAPVALPGF